MRTSGLSRPVAGRSSRAAVWSKQRRSGGCSKRRLRALSRGVSRARSVPFLYSDAPSPPVPSSAAIWRERAHLIMFGEPGFGVERLAKIDASPAASDCPANSDPNSVGRFVAAEPHLNPSGPTRHAKHAGPHMPAGPRTMGRAAGGCMGWPLLQGWPSFGLCHDYRVFVRELGNLVRNDAPAPAVIRDTQGSTLARGRRARAEGLRGARGGPLLRGRRIGELPSTTGVCSCPDRRNLSAELADGEFGAAVCARAGGSKRDPGGGDWEGRRRAVRRCGPRPQLTRAARAPDRHGPPPRRQLAARPRGLRRR